MKNLRWCILVLVWVGASACRKDNQNYCPGTPEDQECPVVDGRPCASSGECKAPTPVCNVDKQVCVQCTRDGECPSERPHCDDTSNKCFECTAHSECDSLLCIDGTCALTEDVTYVAEGGTDNAMCSKALPCQNLVQALQPTALRKYVKATGNITHTAATVIDGKTVTIYGDPGVTSIARSGPDEVLQIRKDSKVELIDLEILGNNSSDKDCVKIEMPMGAGPLVTMSRVKVHNHSGTGAGISISGGKLSMIDSQVFDNSGDGVRASGGILEIGRSLIHGNRGTAGVYAVNAAMVTIDSSVIAKNTGLKGGVAISGGFVIVNSVIVRNGGANSVIGGLELTTLNGQFEFNTVADNLAPNAVAISCGGARLSSSILLSSNLVGATCSVDYSLTATTGTAAGTNKIGEPMFRETMDHLSPLYYRIDQNSAARDSADPTANLSTDIDGQARSDGRPDMGADEYN
jgi:hypothetical protein